MNLHHNSNTISRTFPVAAIFLAALAINASAATITVNSGADVINADDDQCTLREAIIAANDNSDSGQGSDECAAGDPGEDTITFSGPSGVTIGGNPLPEITEALVIEGPFDEDFEIFGDFTGSLMRASAPLTINGLALFRAGGAGGTAINMTAPASLTLSNCRISDTDSQNGGGGIVFRGGAGTTRLDIDSCVLDDNTVTNASAGAIKVIATEGPAEVQISNSTFTGNSGGNGAALFLFLPSQFDDGQPIDVEIERSTFFNNASSDDGGAIHSASAAHTIRILDSTFESNSAAGTAGAVFSSGPSVQITNSTFHGNAADESGGALWVVHALPNTATIASSTITGNTANLDGGNGRGGGVAGQAQDIRLRNTVIAENSAPGGSGPDCADQPVSDGYNLIGAVNDCTFGAITGDQTGNLASPLSPVLGPMADNGGPTRTRLPQPSSPLLDAGNPGGCTGADGTTLTTDQRGEVRVADGGLGAPRCDIGSAERVTATLNLQLYGEGRVTSTPAGIDCPGQCNASFLVDSTVTLLPEADAGFQFLAWDGDCTGSADCQLVMSDPRSVEAIFSNDPIIVNSTTDTVSDDGSCTLREAVSAANNNLPSGSIAGECSAGSPLPATDTIGFAAGLSGTIGLTAILPTIGEPLHIEGPGRDNLALSGSTSSNGMIATTAAFSIAGLTLRDSQTSGFDKAVQVGAPATFTDCRFTNNSGDRGGALFVLDDVEIHRCEFEGNQATEVSGGGAIFANVPNLTITVTDSRFTQNEATSGSGGAMRITGSGTIIDIAGSTFNGNIADGSGGGVSVGGADLLITNSTFSGNEAGPVGGAVSINAGGTLSIASSTIVDNIARSGGGLSSGLPASDAVLRNTIFAGNTDSDNGLEPDCSGEFSSTGYNLVGILGTFCSGLTDGVNGDQVGSTNTPLDPELGPLADNGGPTPTRPLLLSSPALDAGDPSGCLDAGGNALTEDQRGFPRPFDGDGDGTSVCDIGAFELADDTIFSDRFEN